MELVQHEVLDFIRVPFLVTEHTKFVPDRVFASIGSSYNISDVFNIEELVAVAGHFSTTVEELEQLHFTGEKNFTRSTQSFRE